MDAINLEAGPGGKPLDQSRYADRIAELRELRSFKADDRRLLSMEEV